MEYVDITVIGAGVVGLAIASQVARRGRSVFVLEKNASFGQETSSRNSGVIHAGIYYPDGSLKARLCVEGNRLLYEICPKFGIPHGRLGKVIVATSDAEAPQLETLYEQGRRNGVENLRRLSAGELRAMEPEVGGVAALFSPTTGIIDAHSLMSFFLNSALEGGATVVYRVEVTGFEREAGGYRVLASDSGGHTSFLSRVVVNCAGLNSDKVAEAAGIDVEGAGYRLHYCKGEYFRLSSSKRGLVKRLVYPVPAPKGAGLGIHITLDLEGGIRLGPNALYLDRLDYSVDASQKQPFFAAARRLVPSLQYEDLEPDFAGVRPTLQGPQDGFRDFVIQHEADKGLPGLINLIGIESPGLTCAPAIARLVQEMVDRCL